LPTLIRDWVQMNKYLHMLFVIWNEVKMGIHLCYKWATKAHIWFNALDCLTWVIRYWFSSCWWWFSLFRLRFSTETDVMGDVRFVGPFIWTQVMLDYVGHQLLEFIWKQMWEQLPLLFCESKDYTSCLGIAFIRLTLGIGIHYFGPQRLRWVFTCVTNGQLKPNKLVIRPLN
jgi:hypothetical protein